MSSAAGTGLRREADGGRRLRLTRGDDAPDGRGGLVCLHRAGTAQTHDRQVARSEERADLVRLRDQVEVEARLFGQERGGCGVGFANEDTVGLPAERAFGGASGAPLVTVWSMLSSLVQVTVVPAGTSSAFG